MRVEAIVLNQAELEELDRILKKMSSVERAAFEMSEVRPTYLPALSKNPTDKKLRENLIISCLEHTIQKAESKPLSHEEYPPELTKEEMNVESLRDYADRRADEEINKNGLNRIKQVLFCRRESLFRTTLESALQLEEFSSPEQIPDEVAIDCAKEILDEVTVHGFKCFS